MLENNTMAIVWPAMGCPQPLTTGCELRVVAVLPAGRPEDSVSGMLAPVVAGELLSLELLSATVRPIEDVPSPGPWPAWVVHRFPRVTELCFRVPSFSLAEGRRITLCNLELRVGKRALVKPSAVFLTSASRSSFRFLAANDIHIARRWQEIKDDVDRLFPRRPERMAASVLDMTYFHPDDTWTSDCFSDSFVDPNRNFARFIKTANKLWENGELDAILLTGDLVDYKFSAARAEPDANRGKTEWSLFEDLVLGRSPLSERLLVPMYTAVGNHDYRLYPYKLQIYGIRHAGIADEMTAEYLKRAGLWQRWKYRISDLDAIRIDSKGMHSLDHYHERINPFAFYSMHLHGSRLLALDSGPDFYCSSSISLTVRLRSLLSSLFHIKGAPRSLGLPPEQLTMLRHHFSRANETGPVIVATHAPLINPAVRPDPVGVETPLGLCIEPPISGREDDTSRLLSFEKRLHQLKLDVGTVFLNPLPFLETIRRSSRQVVVLSGHNHWELDLTLRRADGQFHADHYTGREDLSDLLKSRVLLLQTAALGHIKQGATEQGRPSYRTVVIDHDRLQEASTSILDAEPFSDGASDWQITRENDRECIHVLLRRPPRRRALRWTTVVCWLRGAVATIPRARLESMTVTMHPASAIKACVDRRQTEDGGYLAFVTDAEGSLDLTIANRPSNVAIAFVFQHFVAEDGRYRLCRLRRHHRLLE